MANDEIKNMCIEFINSEFRDFRGRWVRDDLLQPEWLEQFLSRWDLQTEYPLAATTLNELLELRSLLRRLIETIEQLHVASEDLTALNAILLKPSLKRRLIVEQEGYRLETLPEKKDWSWVQAEIAASFVHILTEHEPTRLKICANPYCRGIFYDESRSRTRRYCSIDKCANLWKVRNFRERARQKEPDKK
jgi:predicted RNA-binding Zn ribbon-like protein